MIIVGVMLLVAAAAWNSGHKWGYSKGWDAAERYTARHGASTLIINDIDFDAHQEGVSTERRQQEATAWHLDREVGRW